ncbi:MAG: hypothetical protein QY306_16085 [Anaerolineales bacterium]|nr:MAG: hypothetical protein QY306_16085 [Anaerolineales bacterium]
MKRVTILAILLTALVACQNSTPTPLAPITTATETEFTLGPGQSAAIVDAVFTIRLIGVTNDERCPAEIECVVSGPVTFTITLQKAPGEPVEYTLQSFTDHDGRSPDGPFEGIQDRIEYEGYVIRVKGVLPYPLKSMDEVKDWEYRVSFIVTKK